MAQGNDEAFVVRECWKNAWLPRLLRLAGDGKHTIADDMREVRIQELHRIQVTNEKGHSSEAILEIRYRRIRVLPPIGKQKQHPELMLTVGPQQLIADRGSKWPSPGDCD